MDRIFGRHFRRLTDSFYNIYGHTAWLFLGPETSPRRPMRCDLCNRIFFSSTVRDRYPSRLICCDSRKRVYITIPIPIRALRFRQLEVALIITQLTSDAREKSTTFCFSRLRGNRIRRSNVFLFHSVRHASKTTTLSLLYYYAVSSIIDFLGKLLPVAAFI